MANVILQKMPQTVGLATVLIVRKDTVGKTLVITDNEEINDYMKSKGEEVILLCSLGQIEASQLYTTHKDYDRIIITSPKIIARYYNETVGVKVNKAKELFEGFNADIIILSTYENNVSIVSNSVISDGVRLNLNTKKISSKAKSLRRFK